MGLWGIVGKVLTRPIEIYHFLTFLLKYVCVQSRANPIWKQCCEIKPSSKACSKTLVCPKEERMHSGGNSLLSKTWGTLILPIERYFLWEIGNFDSRTSRKYHLQGRGIILSNYTCLFLDWVIWWICTEGWVTIWGPSRRITKPN